MMNFDDTVKVLTTFYIDCQVYHAKQTNDPHKAVQLALKDVQGITTNPFSPNGEKLHTEAKKLFIATMNDEYPE